MRDVVFASSASDRRLARAPGKVSRQQQRVVLRRQERIDRSAANYAGNARRRPVQQQQQQQQQQRQMPDEALDDTPRAQPTRGGGQHPHAGQRRALDDDIDHYLRECNALKRLKGEGAPERSARGDRAPPQPTNPTGAAHARRPDRSAQHKPDYDECSDDLNAMLFEDEEDACARMADRLATLSLPDVPPRAQPRPQGGAVAYHTRGEAVEHTAEYIGQAKHNT